MGAHVIPYIPPCLRSLDSRLTSRLRGPHNPQPAQALSLTLLPMHAAKSMKPSGVGHVFAFAIGFLCRRSFAYIGAITGCSWYSAATCGTASRSVSSRLRRGGHWSQGGARLLTRQSTTLSSTHGASCPWKGIACAGLCVDHVSKSVINHSVCVGRLGIDDSSVHLADTLATFLKPWRKIFFFPEVGRLVSVVRFFF